MHLIDDPEIYRTILDNVAAGVCDRGKVAEDELSGT